MYSHTLAFPKRLLIAVLIGVGSLTAVAAPASAAADTAARMGATCIDGGTIQTTVQVAGGRNQWVASKVYVQKYNFGTASWETSMVSDWDVFQLTFTNSIDYSVGVQTQPYQFSNASAGYYRLWALVYYWGSSGWYGGTWAQPDLYNVLTGGVNITSNGQWCQFS